MNGYRHILISVDGSLGPLKEGLKLAQKENCWVTILKVTPPYEGDLDLTGVRNISDVISSGRQQAIMAIRKAVREEGTTAWVMVEEGDIPETISQVAARENCDLIIMGRKKDKSTLRRILEGDLVNKVTNEAPCPVKVVDV